MSDNVKFTSYNGVNDVANELFESLFSRYQDNLETSMRRSDFVFDLAQLMHLKCHRVTFKRSGSYIHSAAWLKNKKATIDPQDRDNKCFQHAATVAFKLSRKRNTSRKWKWNGIKYPSKLEDWKRFEKNHSEITLNILYGKNTEILPAYISSQNSMREKQIILLMIWNEEKGKEGWHYLTVKRISVLLRRKTCLNCYGLNCLHSFRTENKLKSHEKARKDKDFCNIKIPSQKNKILKVNDQTK